MTTEHSGLTTVSVEHLGIVYTGEVIRTQTWQPSHGQPLASDAYFRVVFLESPSNVFPRSLHDHRIAVYVPGARSAELERAEVALRAMREAMGTYATDSDTFDLLSTETHQIEDRAVDAWADSFRGGQLVSAPSLEASLEEIFGDGYWSTWAERIGKLLLERAYPTTPIRAELLQIPLRPEADAPVIFRAAIGDNAGPAAFALDSFGPALGLSSSLAPRVADISKCDVAQRISSMVNDGSPPSDIGHALAHEIGLTYPLATAYLLLWISAGHHSVRLRPGHGLVRLDGSPVEGDAIGPDDARALRWPFGLWERIETLSQADAPPTIDPYLAVLAGEAAQGADIEVAAMRRISEVKDDLPQVAHSLTKLATAQRRHDLPRELALLHEIASADSVDAALTAARRGAPTPVVFAATMALWQAWATADAEASDLAAIGEWLAAATIDEAANEIFAEHELLTKRLQAPRLLTSPHQWASLAETGRLFMRQYATAYLRQHHEYHAEVGALAHAVDAAWRKSKALQRLNAMPAHGLPLGLGLSALAEEMRNSVMAFGSEREIADIETAPMCPTCGMPLGATPPTHEVAQLTAYVEEALGEQNRRLALAIAHRIIERPGHDQTDRFIQVVQISDLSGLANVLDDVVVEFITELLDHPEAPPQVPTKGVSE
jgi:hypothetical protein